MEQIEELKIAHQAISKARTNLMEALKNESNLSYIAGFFDGEGCISTGRHRPTSQRETGQSYIRVKVSVSQRFPQILLYIRDYFGFGEVYEVKDGTQWRYSCSSSQQTMSFLQALLPYLKVKRRQAELGIQLADNIYRFTSESKCRNGISDDNRIIRDRLALEINKLKGEDYE